MKHRGWNCLLFLFTVLTTFISANNTENWQSSINILLNKCLSSSINIKGQKPPFFDAMRSCLQRRALFAMDVILSTDVIPVLNGLDLVRYKKEKITDSQDEKNGTSNARDSGKTWRENVLGRVAHIFKTHVLKVDIDRLTGATDSNLQTARGTESDLTVEGRRRHRRRNQLMPMLMMGVMIMGSVLIPMGFQFLAVLGGKALILAKLALMLSSIQGLKKVATNGVNYGFHHSPEGWHERSSHEPTAHYEVPYQIYSRV